MGLACGGGESSQRARPTWPGPTSGGPRGFRQPHFPEGVVAALRHGDRAGRRERAVGLRRPRRCRISRSAGVAVRRGGPAFGHGARRPGTGSGAGARRSGVRRRVRGLQPERPAPSGVDRGRDGRGGRAGGGGVRGVARPAGRGADHRARAVGAGRRRAVDQHPADDRSAGGPGHPHRSRGGRGALGAGDPGGGGIRAGSAQRIVTSGGRGGLHPRGWDRPTCPCLRLRRRPGAKDRGGDRRRAASASLGGESYERLTAIKTTYDPHNRFRINHNIPPRPGTGG
jgi:hypothetical protein